MAAIFWLQFRALLWKNWIVLSKHSVLNILRCFIFPIAYGAFLATAQSFLIKPNDFGIGTPASIFPLQSQFNGQTTLVWADGTDGTSDPTPEQIISHITANFTHSQLTSVQQLSSPADIPAACPQNFNFFSQCFAAIAFTNIPADGNASNPINYTIFGDAGLAFIDVIHHASDFEERILPLQWAIDRAIIELQTGIQQQTPLEWPFSQETNAEQATRTRLSFIRGIRELIVLAFYVAYIGIAYQLPGSVAGERAILITEYMGAMGLLDSARILSWYISICLAYLPAWIGVALTWKFRVFTETNTGLILVVHLLLGLVLASWSFFIAAPFGKSPHLAAVASTFLGLVFAVLAIVVKTSQSGTLFIFSVLFPPSFYIFAIKAICGYENHQFPTNALKGDPDRGIVLLPLIIAAIIDVFLWPYLAVLWERHLYNASLPSKRSWAFWKKRTMSEEPPQLPEEDIAISIRGLTKIYKTSRFSSKGDVTAVSNLSLDIPRTGIFVLLGSNGAGKSTALSIIGGLSSITSGTVIFERGLARPPRGTLGLVPQKNVLFPELTCLQTLRVWRAVKWSKHSLADEDLEQLLRDCDLEKKIHSNAATLSGGQKRKLQLAIGLVGGSQIMLVDECTSGVDPLSRRALWRTLTSFRDDRCIVFTTHFLDEADLLADHIAILAAPGKVVASGPPVALKRDLGEGYSIQVTFTPPVDIEKIDTGSRPELLLGIKNIAPQTYVTMSSPYLDCYHLKAKDTEVVRRVLGLLDDEKDRYGIASYDILGTTIEDIFLDLMNKNEASDDSEIVSEGAISPRLEGKSVLVDLPTGRPVSPFQQAFTIFYKRMLIVKRSWLIPLLTVIIAIAGATISLVFISGEPASCAVRFLNATSVPLYLPSSPPSVTFTPGSLSSVITSPPNITDTLGNSTEFLAITNVPDNATFVNFISQNFQNLSLGGVSLDTNTGASLIAWEATPPGRTGLSMLNLATNLLYTRALNMSGHSAQISTLILANYATFPPVDASTLVSLRWVIIFGAAMAVYTAFYALYVTKERRSSVQAMQFSNGLTDPIGLWLGHLMFDAIWSIILSSVIIIIFAAVSNQFHGLGFLWVVLILYGFAGALFSYCVSLIVTSPLAAFATVAGYQFIISILYVASPLLVLTYGKTTESSSLITIIHFTTSIAAPVANVLRAALVSINMFSLLCEGNSPVNTTALGSITKFGGPILYLFVYPFVLLAILVWADSGSRRLRPRKGISSASGSGTTVSSSSSSTEKEGDVVAAADAVSKSDDLLRVLNISKMYNGNQVVDDVSLGVPRDTLFALLGPNGAGKTTTFNIIRGDVVPDMGDVLIDGVSVVRHPRIARSALGVCPQFTAIDSQLSVREHLIVYGRLKGLRSGQELEESVQAILESTALNMYADRLASKLSGGNQRKLSLAIALIGNPSVILIDEFSTGIDPKMKREMWQTLRRVARGKAVIITTHSMEEASALANSVGILAKRVLAVGSTESLSARHAAYEVHFTCRTRDEIVKARALMAKIPGSRMADDVATRFEVPIIESESESDKGVFSLGQLFNALSGHGRDDTTFTEYTVEKATLESVFIKVIRENNVREEDDDSRRRQRGHGDRSWWKLLGFASLRKR